MVDEQFRQEVKDVVREALQEREKRSRAVDVLRILITPVTIAVVSAGVTYYVGLIQARNARIIADAQISSAERIASSQLENQKTIKQREMEIQRIAQISPIFHDIINAPDNVEAAATEISALAIYRNTALEYLIKIQEHYSQRETANRRLAQTARSTISSIIANSQIRLSGFDFGGRIMRYSDFENYNFMRSSFDDSNLYRSNFRQASLQGARFNNTDLYAADFTGANLEGASFGAGTNLRRTNFEQTKLDRVTFDPCVIHIEDAKFSFGAAVNATDDPFRSLSAERYVWLLKPHLDELRATPADHPDLRAVLDKLKLPDKQALIDRLHGLEGRQPPDLTDCSNG